MLTLENYEYEERAAIKEFDAGLTRDEAERIASLEVSHMHDKLYQSYMRFLNKNNAVSLSEERV